ncbi:hypothetical protein [Christensenella tenuis]|uniref:Portal protein n=1 Tax=Christensenella tenuis TaxID=2763033 RepID=A0ABR7EGV2_9FIRM|nr:hypothetical protein [Christensenella tenuis]MBC5648264.1 hypothetical protein [Christensenella tenuis]
MKKNDGTRLREFRQKYETAYAAYGKEREAFFRRRAQYEGDHTICGGKDADVVWNFTMELIESQIDSYIPQPKVTPKRPTEKNKRLAAVIEDMLKNELDRMPFEYLNDEDERTVKTLGGSAYLVEWDNALRTHDTVGGLNVRLLDPTEFVPQEGVCFLPYMDYLFLMFEDTKERLSERYGVDVSNEGVDPQVGEQTLSNDTCTQIVCYYRNKTGGLGCFSWAGNTVLIDDEDYEARKDKICAECGRTKPIGEEACACGCTKWETRSREYEELKEDIVRSDGTVIPAISPVMENGTYVMEEYEKPMTDPETGLPMFERQFDEMGLPIGDVPKMERKQRAKYAHTKIPYYYPKRFPIAIRKNVSARGQVLGDSDCDAIRDFQTAANKLLTKVNKKLLGAGSYLTKPKDMDITLSDEDVKPINITSPDQINMLKSITMNFDVEQDLNSVQQYYQMAKSTLGITDTFQGKADPTATSGRAKEAQIAQAAGRQNSKQVMKNAAYAEMYEIMFKFMLAYADEPRAYASKNEEGEPEERVFNRYDFLEQDEAGNWYYEDGFLFSVDENGTAQRNRQFILEDLRTDFGLGAYGNPQDPRSMLRYWRVKEGLNYPNAKQMVKEWQKEIERMAKETPAASPGPEGQDGGLGANLALAMPGAGGGANNMGGTDGTGQQLAAAPSETGNPDGETGSAGGAAGGMPEQEGTMTEEEMQEIIGELGTLKPETAMEVIKGLSVSEEEKAMLAEIVQMEMQR